MNQPNKIKTLILNGPKIRGAYNTIFATGENLLLKTFYDSLTKNIKTKVTVYPSAVRIKFDKITETNQVSTGSVITSKDEKNIQSVLSEQIDKQVILFIIFIGFLILKFKRYL